MTVVIGDPAATRVSRVRTYDVNKGLGYEERWEGTPAVVEEKFNQVRLDTAIDTARYESVGGVGVLTQIILDDDGIGGGQTTEEQNSFWEVLPMDLYKPLKNHEFFSENTTSLQDAELEKYRGLVEMAKDFSVDGLGEPTKTFVQIFRKGTDEYLRTQVVLQKTVPLGRRSVIAASWAGIDRAHVLNTADPGPNPPSEIIGIITALPDYISGAKQWLKRGPHISQITNARYTITYTWFFARRWSKLLFGGDNVKGNE